MIINYIKLATMLKKIFALLSIFAIMQTLNAQEEARLLRFPAINGNQLVFSYAGDLYSVNASGGLARKLTDHIGYEMFAKFSPDGKTIAFTGQYDGNTEVFKMPAEGGEPQRLTYTATLDRDEIGDRMGPNNIVMSWTPDGKKIIYRSRCYSYNDFRGQLFLVNPEGGMPEEMPLNNGGWNSYSPDGKKLAFNRVFREFRTWKHYTGGMADDVWVFDFETKKTENITNNKAQDIFPMWHGKEIYFLSDRDFVMNLFKYNTDTKVTSKVTDFKDFDIKFPSIGGDFIVFEKGGFIFKFNILTQQIEKVNIQISNDLNWGRNKIVDASKLIFGGNSSPNGERLIFSARGDIFNIPAKEGVTKNITKSSSAHDKYATWSPDGKWIAFVSDKSGEFEIYIQDPEGKNEAIQLTSNADTYKYNIEWSPDSKKIIWSDKKLRLSYVDVSTKKVTQITASKMWEIRDYSWSPDSKWVAYADDQYDSKNKIFIYNLETGKSEAVTDGWFDVSSPVFSSCGKYLFLVSGRSFNPTYSSTEWNHSYSDMSKIYLITLAKDTKNPFALVNDALKVEEAKKEDKKETDTKKNEEKPENNAVNKNDVKIDFDGIINRIVSLPIEAGNYWNLECSGTKVYYNTMKNSDEQNQLKMFDLKNKKETPLGKGMSFSLSPNKEKMIIMQRGQYYVIDLPNSNISLSESVSLENMKMSVNYSEEWKQIYYESWRQMRDFFFDPNMHGVDWKAMRDKYAVLLPYVKHRDDLTYIIGELIAEINIGHAYVNSGEKPNPSRIKMGLLGAKFSKDASGYFKIEKILEGANWEPSLQSPLTEIGVDVKVGDFILAINGESTKNLKNIYEALIGLDNKTVELTVNNKASSEGARNVLVSPRSTEASLYYYNWVQNNIKKVSEATGGQVGYIHIPDMGVTGLNEFVKYFYPQLRKKALIIDDRGNGGGNVSPMIIERLARQWVMTALPRNATIGITDPTDMHLGPKVMLIDNYSASDGDIFPYRFKSMNLGKIIGVRTWGAITGIRGSLPFVDGGDLRKPEFAKYDKEGKSWLIEGQGITPDIVVDNDPYKEYMGEDQQLSKAIEVILEEIKNWKDWIQPIPDYPIKNK